MSLILQYLKIHYMSQMTYKTSFILLCIGQFFVPFLIFISMLLLFQQFDHLINWSLYETALVYSIIHMAFSISEILARGFDMFSHCIRDGSFDRLLVRPRSIILQVFGSKIEFTRIGRLLQSILVMIYAISHLDMVWTLGKISLLVSMVVSGVVVFTGVFILGATLCFWTIEGMEVVNLFTDGGREMAQYPLGIYKKWVKNFFTFVIPFGLVNYYPMLYLLGKSNDKMYAIAPLVSTLFILPCISIFNMGIKHYKSTGS